jgi:hypothetical protein
MWLLRTPNIATTWNDCIDTKCHRQEGGCIELAQSFLGFYDRHLQLTPSQGYHLMMQVHQVPRCCCDYRLHYNIITGT